MITKEMTAKIGYMSEIIITTPNESLDISPLVVQVKVTESLFKTFIKGSILVSEMKSSDAFKGKRIPTDLTSKIQFSFSGKEDDGETNQPEITINSDDYLIYKITPGVPFGTSMQTAEIFFAHKSAFKNENRTISKSFKQKKISEMVQSLGKEIDLKFKTVESTDKKFNFVLPYRTVVEQIMFLTPYARREENPSDVNYVFYQDLKGKHNFTSVAKLFSQPSFNTKNDPFGFGFNADYNFKTARRSMLEMKAREGNQFQNAQNGMHSSVVMTLDTISKIWSACSFFLPSIWPKQTHLSNQPTVEPSSEFYEYVNGSYDQRFYAKNRHSHCCKEQKNCNNKIGGEDDWLLPRISNMEQLNQYAVLFKVTGFSDLNKLSAGKTIYISRPYQDTEDGNDILYSGKYLVTTITHNIIRNYSSQKLEYTCDINCIKDSIGEE